MAGESPISAAMIARSHGVGEPRWSPSGRALAWLDSWNGRTDVVIAPTSGDRPPRVVTADFAVTPAGAYGGGGFCWISDDELAVAGADGRLAVVPVAGGPARILSRDGVALAPAASPDGRMIAFSLDRDDACDIAVVPVDGSEWPRRMSYADYAWDAAWSPDSTTLAWLEWDLDEMSWDESRIAVCALTDSKPTIVAGGPGEGVGQPRFSPDGAHLAWVSDRSGVMNIWVANADGSDAQALAEEYEHASPAWGPGQRTYAWFARGGRLAYCRNEDGFGRLVSREVDAAGEPGELAKAWHNGIDWSEAGIVAVRSGARTPSTVVVTDAATGERREIARGPVAGFEAAGLVEPEPVTWETDGTPVHGLLYRPATSALGVGTKPPLYVHIHGGPTSQVTAEWNPRIAYWVSRGWAVLAPNYRGSSGYGREYAQGLRDQWGVVDVADTAAGIRNAIHLEWCDPRRVVVVGGSAGGMTVLLMCALHGDLVRAGVSLFGVTDLFELARTTHRFESKYLDALIGKLPADADRYRDRSPITHADKIRVPVLVLQGDEDRAVPKPQADAMVDAMRAAGAPVEYHVYAGEGHGFRKLENVVDELERTEAFLTKWVLAAVSETLLTEIELQGPARGADRAVLLAHGAGADMHAATLTTFADSLAAAGVPVMRFNFPYRTAGKRAPDRPAVLAAATREAAAELASRTQLPPERLVLGGRSMGGRYMSLAVGDADDPLPALGLLLLGYPLHPAGKPEKLRVEHFPRISVPVLFVSGTRDSLAGADALRAHAKEIVGPVAFHWIESADHGFKPLKASGLTVSAALAEAAIAATAWVTELP